MLSNPGFQCFWVVIADIFYRWLNICRLYEQASPMKQTYHSGGEVTMVYNKSDPVKDEIWDQHLRRLDLVSNECKSNQLKREREKGREETRSRNSPENNECPANG